MLSPQKSPPPLKGASSYASVLSSPGLPSEQYAALAGRQKVEGLFSRGGSSQAGYSPSPPKTPRFNSPQRSYAGLTQEQRLHASEVRHATRKLRGPSFDFDDESYSSAGRHRYGGHWDYRDDGKPIPQKYIDEFNQKWHEDDEDNDADQFIADYQCDATWREHQSVYSCSAPRCEYEVADMTRHVEDYKRSQGQAPRAHRRTVRRAEAEPRPDLFSKFSWDSSDDSEDSEAPKKSTPLRRRKSIGEGLRRSISRSRRE
ncbi:hypothetical protein BU26DRAFT_558308 [Trematosphaeria pertusa]|uniref:Uncharacterized protein n=1 Tax=Trematosphaeria pertusa TaxID=390896 RepID=A0A6A6J3T4_9PLEO|nr:uncharacterized protein BU26DRAFT_558308 [Trematosphaeria pertusa]KAF2256872.1 hypothetical protein BU26DRAFT_558308 [Trematosphaeria pertusa]